MDQRTRRYRDRGWLRSRVPDVPMYLRRCLAAAAADPPEADCCTGHTLRAAERGVPPPVRPAAVPAAEPVWRQLLNNIAEALTCQEGGRWPQASADYETPFGPSQVTMQPADVGVVTEQLRPAPVGQTDPGQRSSDAGWRRPVRAVRGSGHTQYREQRACRRYRRRTTPSVRRRSSLHSAREPRSARWTRPRWGTATSGAHRGTPAKLLGGR